MRPLHRQLAAGMRQAAGPTNDLLDHLVSYWPFTNNPGEDVHKPPNIPLHVRGTVTVTNSAPTGNGVRLNAVGDYIEKNNDLFNSENNSWALSIWGNLHNFQDTGFSFIVNRRGNGSDDTGVWIFYFDDRWNKVVFSYWGGRDDNSKTQAFIRGKPSLKTWHHYVIGLNWDTKLVSLYIDGQLKASETASSVAPGQNNRLLRFGNRADVTPNSSNNWDGEMADCGYWIGRAPDQQMVDALWNNGNGLTYDKFQ